MFPAMLLPVAGWIAAQFYTARIRHTFDFTGALVHTLAIDVFAVLLLLSMLINCALVSSRLRDGQWSLVRPTRFPLVEAVTIATSSAWLATVCLSDGSVSVAEPILATSIAVASVLVFACALRTDAASRGARAARRAASAVALTSEQRVRLRRLRWQVPIALVGVLIVAVATTESVPVTHRNCTFEGAFSDSLGRLQVSSERCGDFSFRGDPRLFHSVSESGKSYDIVTRGFDLDFPPIPHVSSIVEVR